ncbi:MAG: RNA-guided endonuclease TnpB family protein, partial [Cyanobacteria bacterium J06635_10]
MARSKTPSFITELPLKVDSNQERGMLARFQAARQLYNACLNEALLRMSLVKNSEPYQQAKNMRGGDKKRRAELFAQARKQYRFSEYDLGDFG